MTLPPSSENLTSTAFASCFYQSQLLLLARHNLLSGSHTLILQIVPSYWQTCLLTPLNCVPSTTFAPLLRNCLKHLSVVVPGQRISPYTWLCSPQDAEAPYQDLWPFQTEFEDEDALLSAVVVWLELHFGGSVKISGNSGTGPLLTNCKGPLVLLHSSRISWILR